MPVFSAGGASAFAVTTNSQQIISAMKTFQAGTATARPLVVQAASGQTANLTEWQNSSGTVLASISASGAGTFNSSGIALTAQASGTGNLSAFFVAGDATGKPLIVRGAASQSANLQEWQNSGGTVLASVTAGGVGTFNGANIGNGVGSGFYQDDSNAAVRATKPLGSGAIYIQGASGTPTYAIFGSGLGVSALIYGVAPAQQALIVRGAASQTANLQEWQNSAGTYMGGVDSGGSIYTTANLIASNDVRATQVYAQGSPNGTAKYYSAMVNVTPVDVNRKGIVVQGLASQSANLQEWQNNAGTMLAGIDSSGHIVQSGANTTTSATAGGQSSLPATITGYLIVVIAGTNYKIPYYNA